MAVVSGTCRKILFKMKMKLDLQNCLVGFSTPSLHFSTFTYF